MEFQATVREKFGKSHTNLVRRSGNIPGTLYAMDRRVSHLSFNAKIINKHTDDVNFLNTVCKISIEGKEVLAVVKNIEFHYLDDSVNHIEFFEITKKSTVCVPVPVKIHNKAKSVGIKGGGKVNLPFHSINVQCPASSIPKFVDIDIENYGIGRVIFTRHIKIPENCKFPKDVFVMSILGRGRKDSAEEAQEEGSVNN